MINNNQIEEHDLLFTINNTPLLIIERLFWFMWFELFCIILFANTAQVYMERGIIHSYGEFFISQLTNGRFFLVSLIFLIIAPISTIYSIGKIIKNNNNVYFNLNEITYHGLSIPIENIDYIKIGCCPVRNSNIFIYFLIFVVGGIITVSLVLFNLLSLYILKILNKSDVPFMTHKYIIVAKNGKNILGLLLKKKEIEQLIAFKNKYHIGEKMSEKKWLYKQG
jgi:hypothetical protein